jgi:hypothetical protein
MIGFRTGALVELVHRAGGEHLAVVDHRDPVAERCFQASASKKFG